MRITELAYGARGGSRSLVLHPRLTVVTGLGPGARAAWAQRIFELLHGMAPAPAAAPGWPSHLVTDGPGIAEDDWLARLGADAQRTARHMILDAEALWADIEDAADPDSDNAEVRQLRALLDRAETEHEAAAARHREVERLRQRFRHLEALVHAGDERAARHRHGLAVLQVSRLETEVALLGGGSTLDRQSAEAAVQAARAVETWRASAQALEQARITFGPGARLDPARLARGLQHPTEVPAGLETVHDAYLAAVAHRDVLQARLHEAAAAELPDTGPPWGRQLARLEQGELWSLAEGLVARRLRVTDLALGLGDPDGTHRSMVAQLDSAHEAVELAERVVARTRFPALAKGAKRTLAQAREDELAVFGEAGFGSWLGFQLRRVDAALEPDGMALLRSAEEDMARCQRAWDCLAPGVDPEAALAARSDIEGLADTLAAAEAHRGSFDAIRSELDAIAEPSLARARDALARVCAPFDARIDRASDDIEVAVREARLARIQVSLVEAEVTAEEAEADLEALLAEAGFPGPAPLGLRAEMIVAQFGGVPLGVADEGRSRDEVVARLDTAREELRGLSRPDWNDTDLLYELLTEEPADRAAASPERLALGAERDRVAEECGRLETGLADQDRLAERRYDLAHRLEQVTASSRQARMEAAEMALIRRFAHTRRAGPEGEPLPLVIDDALTGFPAEDKSGLFGLVHRLSGASQVIYLTGDSETIDWGEAHDTAGTGRLVAVDDSEPDRR